MNMLRTCLGIRICCCYLFLLLIIGRLVVVRCELFTGLLVFATLFGCCRPDFGTVEWKKFVDANTLLLLFVFIYQNKILKLFKYEKF